MRARGAGAHSPVDDECHRSIVGQRDIHHRTEFPCRHLAGVAGLQKLYETLVQAYRGLGCRGIDEAWAAALADISVQSELAHHQNRAIHVGQGTIHLAGIILEDPEADHLVGHPLNLIGRVTLLESYKQELPETDLANHLSLYYDVRFAYALKHDSHALVTPPLRSCSRFVLGDFLINLEILKANSLL